MVGQPAIIIDPVLHAQAKYWERIRHAREDLRTYIEVCGRNEDGDRIELDYIHRAWIWHLDYCWSRGLHAMILAPFGSGKSSTLAVPLTTWLIGNNVQIRIKFVSNGDDDAQRRVAAAKTIMETADYRDVFPNVLKGPRWGDSQVEVVRQRGPIDATLHARGVETRGVGQRADVIIFDDVCDQLNSSEAGRRKKVKEFVSRTWMSRLDQKVGRALWIATPWDPDDATYDLMHKPKWCTLVQRVSSDHLHYEQEVFNAGDDYAPELMHVPG